MVEGPPPPTSPPRSFLRPHGSSIHSLREPDAVTVPYTIIAREPDAVKVPHTIIAFQRFAADLLKDLLVLPPDNTAADILSLAWTRRLLDAFLLCFEEFRTLFVGSGNGDPPAVRSPLDRLVADFFERAVNVLDLCNAVREGLDLVQQWRKRLAIAVAVLTSDHARPHGKGETGICIHRARRALTDLTFLTVDERHGGGGVVGQRNCSNRRGKKDSRGHRHGQDLDLGSSSASVSSSTSGSSSKSSSGSYLWSWSVSRTWSAARQLQLIGGGLLVPSSHDDAATGGLASAVYTMGAVLFIVSFALVAAIPCQDRGLQAHFSSVPGKFLISRPINTFYNRILEEAKKEKSRNSCGLLKEIQQIELCSRRFMECTDAAEFPLSLEKATEVMVAALDLVQLSEYLKDELGPLQGRIREMFHRIVHTRTEILCYLSRPQVTGSVHRSIGTLSTNRGRSTGGNSPVTMLLDQGQSMDISAAPGRGRNFVPLSKLISAAPSQLQRLSAPEVPQESSTEVSKITTSTESVIHY